MAHAQELTTAQVTNAKTNILVFHAETVKDSPNSHQRSFWFNLRHLFQFYMTTGIRIPSQGWINMSKRFNRTLRQQQMVHKLRQIAYNTSTIKTALCHYSPKRREWSLQVITKLTSVKVNKLTISSLWKHHSHWDASENRRNSEKGGSSKR